MSFLSQYIKVHGITVDRAARSRHDGRSTPSVGDKDKEVTKQLESLILATTDNMKMLLGPTWADAQQQGNGQDAFETKTRPVTVVENPKVSSAGLSSLFSLLRLCAERCPYILLQLRNGSSIDEDDENTDDVLLLRQALDSAVPCLLHPQQELSLAAIYFFESTLSHCDSSDETVQHVVVEEFNSRIKPSILCTLLMGCACGKINILVMHDACRLLFKLMQSLSNDDLQALVVQSLSPENFLLGDDVHRTVVSGIIDISLLDLESMMTALWQFHQFEKPEALQRSENTQRFCQQYRKT